MNDNDLRALAAKLLKHYVADQNPVAEAIVAQIPLDRLPAKVVPLITAEQRALLDQLGGQWADTHEGKTVALISQGCGGCGGDGGGSDGGGSDGSGGGEGGGSGGSMGDGVGGGMGDANSAAGTASDADAGTGLSAGQAAGWGGLGDAGPGAEGLAGLADGPDGPEAGLVGLTNDSLSIMSPEALNAMLSQADPGISAAAYSSLANQNAALNDTLDAVGMGLDANAASQGSSGTLGGLGSLGIGSALGELFGISSAQAETNLPTPAPGIPRATGSAAEQWAAQGRLGAFLALDPGYAKDINSSFWDNLSGPYMSQLQAKNDAVLGAQGQQAIYGSQPGSVSGAGGASLGAGPATGPSVTTSTNPLSFAAGIPGSQSPTMTGQFTTAGPRTAVSTGSSPYAGMSPIGPAAPAPAPETPAPAPAPAPTPAPAPIMSPYTGPESEQQSVLTDAARAALAQQQWTASGRPGSPNDIQDYEQGLSINTLDALAAQNAQAANTVGNVAAGLPDVGSPASSSQPAGTSPAAQAPSSPVAAAPAAPSPTAMSSTSTQAQAPSYTGIPAIDAKIADAIANPGKTAINLGVSAIPGLGIANSLSGLLGGPTVGGFVSGLTGAEPGSAPDMGSGSGGDSGSGEFIPPFTAAATGTPASGSSYSLPTAVSPVTTQEAALRKYLGTASDPYRYGFGSERKYYSAKGGMFNADQYFADGGMVQPLSPPTTPLVSAQPTMAYTDGTGAVGNIAQPPGLAQSDAYGSDAPHASPMAPSVAAAVPTMQPGLATLAMPSVNASPTPSPIAQNPNVGYALGNSPLSNLTRS